MLFTYIIIYIPMIVFIIAIGVSLLLLPLFLVRAELGRVLFIGANMAQSVDTP